MKRKRFLLILIGLLILPASLMLSGQEKNFDPWLSPERIFQNRELVQESFGPARWLPDGRTYTTVEKSGQVEGGMDIVAYAAETGKRKILVSAASLLDPEKESPLRIEGYSWSKDGRLLLIFTNSRRVWRLNSRGDYWVFDRVSGNLIKLGKKFETSSLMFAKISPTARKAAYVYRNNIYVEDIESGRVDRLTSDGSETIINGTADWVYEEEFSLRDGFRWSPDGRHLAFWRFDTSPVRDYYLINNADYLYPRIVPIKYPKVGTMNSEVRLGLVDVETGKTDWIELPGDSRKDYYLPAMDWTRDSGKIIFQRLNRLQNTNQLMLFDPASRELRTIFTDRDETWVEVMEDFIWFNGGKNLLWLSERDGWNQVYEISLDGRPARQITSGRYDVVSLSGLDEKRGWLYFIASPDDAGRRYLYRVGLKPGSGPERVTPADLAGTHSYQMSPEGGLAVHTYSTFDSPPVIDLVDLPRHRVLRTLAGNESLKSRLGALKRKPVEFFKVDIGQAMLDGWCLKPPDFDEKRNYPVIVYVYGEPAAQTVLDRWGGNTYLWHLLLAQKGYVVLSIDNRGTPAPKGREWRKAVYRQVGILAPADQAAAIKTLLKKRPWLDGSRIGVWGWSGGGQMTLNAMFKYPELYRTGIAIAFVSDQLLYDTIYQERYMGLPENNAEGYREGSPVNFAGNLKGRLLIIHGTGDDNVHYQSFERLVNELIANNKLFSMMAYPNRSHSISEGKNTTLHLYRTMLDFFLKNLPVK